MIRILHYGLTHNLGGIETYLFKLANNLDKSKYQIDYLILGNNKPCYYEELLRLGCKFFFVTDRKTNPLKNHAEIDQVIQSGNYDIIHCHLNSLSYITPALIGLKNNIPTIVHSRNAGIPASKISRTLHWLNSKIISKKDITKVAVSDYAGKWMFNDASDVKVINNGIDIERFKRLAMVETGICWW